MIAPAATAMREPAVFALAAPAIWITIAVYTDECGQEHVAVARIAAWSEQDACAYLEDQVIEDVLGVDAAEVREAWEQDDPEYGDKLWISEVLAFSTDELNAKRILGTPAACRALALATGCLWDDDHDSATD